MKRIIPVVLILGILGAGAYYFFFATNNHPEGRIVFSGNIEMTETRLSFKRPGKMIVRLFDEGDTITSGAVVARLETTELDRRREKALAAINAAQSRLDMLTYELEQLEENVAASIDQRQAELNQAQATLRELRTGSRDQEIADAKAALQRARTERENARRDYERAKGLYESGVFSQSQYDDAETRYESTETQVEQAQERLSLVIEGPRSERIEAAEAAVERARAALKSARASEIELKRKRLEFQTRNAELEAAESDLALVDVQLDDSILYAPTNGVVLSKSAEPGEVLAAGTPVLTLGDIDHPWVRAFIKETDLGRVKLGDTVHVRTDTFPDKVYAGRISFIASESEFTPKQIQTEEQRTKLVYRVKVDLPNPNHELKLNMPVDGEIVVTKESAS